MRFWNKGVLRVQQNGAIIEISVTLDQVKYKTVKLSQYTDDMCLYLKDTLKCLDMIIYCVSGLLLNLEKMAG